jgi:hypothetical protein
VAHAAVAANFRQALDVQSNFTAEVALDGVVLIDDITQRSLLILGEILHTGVRVHIGQLQNVVRAFSANTENISQSDLDSLFAGQVNTSNTCHILSSTSY